MSNFARFDRKIMLRRWLDTTDCRRRGRLSGMLVFSPLRSCAPVSRSTQGQLSRSRGPPHTPTSRRKRGPVTRVTPKKQSRLQALFPIVMEIQNPRPNSRGARSKGLNFWNVNSPKISPAKSATYNGSRKDTFGMRDFMLDKPIC